MERASPAPCADGHWAPAESHFEAAESVPSWLSWALLALHNEHHPWQDQIVLGLAGPPCNPGERRDQRPSRLSCNKVARHVPQRPPNQLPDRVSPFLVWGRKTGREGWLRARIGHWQASLASHLFKSRPTGTARVPTIAALFHAGLQTWCELDLQQPHPGRDQGGVPGGLSHDDGPKIRLQSVSGNPLGEKPRQGRSCSHICGESPRNAQ